MTHDGLVDDLILSIVHSEAIAEQSDLQNSLRKRGHEMPQATLSRRLKKLNIVKVSGLYKVIDYKQPGLPLVLNVQVSEFGLIVLQTHPGNANSLAYYIDRKYVSFAIHEQNNSGILGTIAGDDTVLLILKSKEDHARVYALLQEEFPYLFY
ncbi:arginine repressor [Legionella sp. km772]|uniref:arginine repressor n=1 Tax=Legionella sp. km772 TaxID=2498111 RepID=UPI000F8F273E|nr:ArgR family transcriptional regulator [Legionella sp. km772]RUR13112.1 ArgR family transcriptional regulator [Legionella sp. km772]